MMTAPEKSKFQWDADDYANHSNVQHQWAKEFISRLGLRGSESLLDVGCGDGKVTAELASRLRAGIVVGIDNSREMVSLAREKFSSEQYPNLSFFCQDARNLSFSEKFDVVFSNAALHWVLDHRPVLEGIYRSLKPGGRVFVQMGGKGNAAHVVATVDEIIASDNWKPCFENFSFPYGFYAPKQYEPWLQEAGFKVISLELKPKDMAHENEEKFRGWFRTTWLPYLDRVPEESRAKFIDAVTEKYLQKYPHDLQGKIHIGMQRLEFVAAKVGFAPGQQNTRRQKLQR